MLEELLRTHDVNERDGHAGADYGIDRAVRCVNRVRVWFVVRVHHAVRNREIALLKLLRTHDVNKSDCHAGADYGMVCICTMRPDAHACVCS